MGLLDGNNALGNWFYNNLQSKVNSDPTLASQVYSGSLAGNVGGLGAGLNLPEFKVSEALAAELPNYTDTTGGGGGGAGGGGGDAGSGTGTGTGSTGTTGQVLGTSSGPSAEEIYRQQQIDNINNKWSSYFGSLDQSLGALPGQADLLNQSAETTSGQQASDLLASTNENKADLNKQAAKNEQNQVKTLKDISSNIRNLMNAGNTYLGSRGAGDSSAVNQYAYALTRLGSQQRGDVMSQTRSIANDINDRLTKVGNIYTQEKNRIDSELTLAKNNISQWLINQQNAIADARRQGEKDKYTDIGALTDNLFNIAIQKATQLQNFYNDKMSALQTWALNSSNTLKEAQGKIANAGSFITQAPTYNPISGISQITSSTPQASYGGYSPYTEEEKKKLYGTAF